MGRKQAGCSGNYNELKKKQSPDGEDHSSEVAMMEWWALGLVVAQGATHDEPNTMLRQPC